MDEECEGRPKGTRNEHKRSCGQKQEQKDLVLLRPHHRHTPDGGERRRRPYKW